MLILNTSTIHSIKICVGLLKSIESWLISNAHSLNCRYDFHVFYFFISWLLRCLSLFLLSIILWGHVWADALISSTHQTFRLCSTSNWIRSFPMRLSTWVIWTWNLVLNSCLLLYSCRSISNEFVETIIEIWTLALCHTLNLFSCVSTRCTLSWILVASSTWRWFAMRISSYIRGYVVCTWCVTNHFVWIHSLTLLKLGQLILSLLK